MTEENNFRVCLAGRCRQTLSSPIFTLFFPVLLLLLLFSCRKENKLGKTDIPVIDKAKTFQYVSEITSIGPRLPGSKGSEKTIEYIRAETENLGFSSKLDKWTEKTVLGEINFCNISVDIKGGNNDFIIVGAHYDTKKFETIPDFSGANDGASGTGLLLAIMKAISESKTLPPFFVKFMFFDGEEAFMKYSDNDGLYGSRRAADKLFKSGDLNKCKAVIIADMVGDRDLDVTIPSDTDRKMADLLFSSAEHQGGTKYFKWYGTPILDDHSPFQKHGIPAIDIIDFNYGASNRYWHTKEDTIDKISQDSLQMIGNVLIRMIYDFPRN